MAEPLDLDAIRRRAEAATPGPWRYDGGRGFDRPEPIASQHNKEDAEFIAHARTDVPVLVAEVERLRASIVDCSGSCKAVASDADRADPDYVDADRA